jgi:hypothetical protein
MGKMIKEMKKMLYICKFKRQFKYDKFMIKNDLKKYILKFKNNFYKDNSNAIKILFDYFIIYNNINLDIYVNKKQAEQLIKLFLWKNCLDYKNFNVIYEKEKYYFKDITNIFTQDNKLKNYVLSYYKLPSDVPYGCPIFLYIKELNKFNNNETNLCLCGNLMEITNVNICYNNSTVCCDFTGLSIKDDEIFHCNSKSNTEHPFGFDISIHKSDDYLNDLLKRKLEKNLYFKIMKYETMLNKNLENISNNLVSTSNKYLKIKKIHKNLCENLINNSIIYYKLNNRDLFDLGLNYLKYRQNLIIRLYNIKRILSIKTDWYDICKNKYEELNNIYSNNLIKLIITLKPYPNMFENNDAKKRIINSYRTVFNIIKEKIEFSIKELEISNLISYDILSQDYFLELNTILNKINEDFYKYYECIEVLENCTTNDNIIEFIPCDSLNNEICIICQEDNENNLVKINNCGHIFHNNCIIEWLTRNNSCPLCRNNE